MATKVLVVDDSITMRALISSALEKISGIQVVGTAESAAEARAEVERLQPDVIIAFMTTSAVLALLSARGLPAATIVSERTCGMVSVISRRPLSRTSRTTIAKKCAPSP